MTKKKIAPSKEEEPVVNIVDRRSAILDEVELEELNSEEERLPSYVEKLKKEAEEKDKKLKEYIAAYKEKTAEDDEFRKRLEKDNDVRLDQFKANLFSRLVPILDNLNRAIEASNLNHESYHKTLNTLLQGHQLQQHLTLTNHALHLTLPQTMYTACLN